MPQDQLIERRDGFNYDFRMRCECGRSSFLAARDYADEINQAHMDCEHCGTDIHFGRAVIAIRDERDHALDDETVPALAWYHSSTWPDWPSSEFVKHTETELRTAEKRLRLGLDHALEQLTTHALHLGTYEAAVENMLRRMHDQADAAARFYLYRVQLQPRLRVEAGYRDENLAKASRLTVPQLEASGLDVVRYLNAYEAEGTLSLAVQPHAIAAVQRIAIPVMNLVSAGPIDKRLGLVHELAANQEEADRASAALAEIPIRQRKLMKLGLRPDPDDLARIAEDLQLHVYSKWNTFEDDLARLYLSDVSRIVIRDFQHALGSWRASTKDADPEHFTARFRQIAALLTNADRVIRLLSAQPWVKLPALPDIAGAVGGRSPSTRDSDEDSTHGHLLRLYRPLTRPKPRRPRSRPRPGGSAGSLGALNPSTGGGATTGG